MRTLWPPEQPEQQQEEEEGERVELPETQVDDPAETADCATQTNGADRSSVVAAEEDEEDDPSAVPSRWSEVDPSLVRDFLAAESDVHSSLPAPGSTVTLDRAMAVVANKWERERRRQLQEAARRDTILRQRKMSAVIKVRKGKKKKKEEGGLREETCF